MFFVFIEILFKILLFNGVYSFTLITVYVWVCIIVFKMAAKSTVSKKHKVGLVPYFNELSIYFYPPEKESCFLSSSPFQVTFFSVTVSLFKLPFYCSLPLAFKRSVQCFSKRRTTLCLFWNYTIHYSQQVRVIERGNLSFYMQMEARCDKTFTVEIHFSFIFSKLASVYI